MNSKLIIGLAAILAPVSFYQGYHTLVDLDRRATVREVVGQITEKVRLLGPDYPQRTTVENLKDYGAAIETIDASRTPDDFQAAFRNWAAAWRAGATDIDKSNGTAKDRADTRIRETTEKLNEVRQKYGA